MILQILLTLAIIFFTQYYINNVYKVKRQMQIYKVQYEKQGYKVMVIPYKFMRFGYLDEMNKYKDNLTHFDLNVISKYDIVVSSLMNEPMLLIINPKLLKQYFTQKDIWIKHNLIFDNMLRLVGRGLNFIEGNYWKKKRQIFSKVFHFEFVVNLIPIMKESIDAAFDRFDEINSQKQNKIKLLEQLIKITTRIVFRGFFGSNQKELKALDHDGKPFELNFLNLNNNVILQSISPIGLILGKRFLEFGIRQQDKQINQQIKEYRHTIKTFLESKVKQIKLQSKQQKKRMNLLQTMYHSGILHEEQSIKEEKLNYKEFIDDFCTFLLAGGQTSSVIATYILIDIEKQSGVKAKIQQEINTYIKTDDDYTYESLSKMTYLDGVILETLRTKSPAKALAIRESTKQCTIGNVRIPKKNLLMVSLLGCSHNEIYFNDATEYKPERWANIKLENDDIFAAIPFSAGERNCIGQHFAKVELKMIIIKFMKRYNYEIKDEIKLVQKLLIQPTNFDTIISRK